MIKNNSNYEVAVINYPLMDPRIKPVDYRSYMQLGRASEDPWGVPIYIHIPFCTSICKFCVYDRQIPDSKKILDDYVEALKREIMLYSKTPYIQSLKIGAIFLGGGTPTTLTSAQLKDIISVMKDYLPLQDTEITVECNVSNAPEEKIRALYEAGVTRISTGVQTFDQKCRGILELKHAQEDIFKWVYMVNKYPFKDISIDLLYGIPGQSIKGWEEDLTKAISLPINHFSIYKLTVFAYTKLYKELGNRKIPKIPQVEEIFEIYLKADEVLKKNGFVVQSSQEYCKKDNKSLFWDLTYDGYGDNLSFGAFSFGYINGVSYQNLPNPKDYIDAIRTGKFPIKMVSRGITQKQLLERTMMLGFRKGFVDKSVFYEKHRKKIADVFGDVLSELINLNYITENDSRYDLTTLGRYYQGDISAKFMKSTFHNISASKKKMAIGNHVVPDALENIKGV